jgi:hypothetical protein
MPISIAPHNETIQDAPFTFLVERVGSTFDGKHVYAISCLVDDYGIASGGFYTLPADYAANLQTAIADTKAKAHGKLETMRAEVARMQAVIDKVAGSGV